MNRARLWLILVVIAVSGPGHAEEMGESGDSSDPATGPAYAVNYHKSTLYWEGSKPGGMHHGTIEVLTGTANVEEDVITGGMFEIAMGSIRNEDIQSDGMRSRLVNHLKSEDFFYVEKYPKAIFRINAVESVSGISLGEDGMATHMINGELTVRGITRNISFPAAIRMDGHMIHARTGRISLDRTRWNVNHMSRSVLAEIKDNYISDQMVVRLDIHFDRN